MRSLRLARTAEHRVGRTTTHSHKDGGAAAVELAIVLPILLLLVFGIIYFGFIFATQISLNSSARDAARAGVVKPLASTGTPLSCSEIATMARDDALTIGLTNTNAIKVTVTNPNGTSCTWAQNASMTSSSIQMCATSGQLTVALEYTMVSPVPLMPLSSVNLKATGAFQCEYS